MVPPFHKILPSVAQNCAAWNYFFLKTNWKSHAIFMPEKNMRPTLNTNNKIDFDYVSNNIDLLVDSSGLIDPVTRLLENHWWI